MSRGAMCENARSLPARGAFLAAILLAAALRLPGLAARPMHADEAIHADKFGTLLQGGGYAYDPSEYHGPTLYYLALAPAWLRGDRRYVDVDEVTLRVLPAALGVLLVAAHAGLRGALGPAAAAAAALLAAVSPALVFYSRYFIHEMLLVLFSFGALLAVAAYLRAPGPGPAALAGACAGLMLATKETAVLALGALLAAFLATRLLAADGPAAGWRTIARHLLLTALVAVAVAALFFTSFLTRPQGLWDAVRAYGFYVERAGSAPWHIHPWTYYLGLLTWPGTGAPFWTEAAILVLAAFGLLAAARPSLVPAASPAALRLVSVYTMLLAAIYSAIPYKTPWCVLGFLHGLILLAGVGTVVVWGVLRTRAARAAAAVFGLAAAAHLGWLAWAGSFRLASDPANPYVYAHTGTDVFEIAGRVRDLARVHPEGNAMPVQVISRTNLWPLPFYLRALTRVEWWNGVHETAPAAPVVLITPDLEPDLVRKLYDLPPPGERELYVSMFERPVELRPQVEVRGYAANRLWERYRARE
jgi:uncharacterized protein (TIGR03663 family)